MTINFSDDNAKVTVAQLNDVIQGMAEKNEERYAAAGSGGIDIVIGSNAPSGDNIIWLRPVT